MIGPRKIAGWRVDTDCFSNSDCNYIQYDVDTGAVDTIRRGTPVSGWAIKKLYVNKLEEYIENEKQTRTADWLSDDPNTAADSYHQYVRSGCDTSMLSEHDTSRLSGSSRTGILVDRRNSGPQKRIYTQTQNIPESRSEGVDRTDMLKAFRTAMKDLNVAIKNSQQKACKELVGSVEADPWGLPYKNVAKKLNRRLPGIEARGRELLIVAHLFPEVPPTVW